MIPHDSNEYVAVYVTGIICVTCIRFRSHLDSHNVVEGYPHAEVKGRATPHRTARGFGDGGENEESMGGEGRGGEGRGGRRIE